MFGNFGKMLKIAGEMREKMPQIQEELANARHEADAGGGVVTAVVDGKMKLVDVKIDPEVLFDADAAMLEDMIKAAVSSAQRKAAEATEAAMRELTGGMDIPGLGPMLDA